MADVYGRLTGPRRRVHVDARARAPPTSSPAWPTPTWIARRSSPSRARARPRACTRKATRSSISCKLFQPITKYSTQIREPQIVPEIVRKAFKVAQTEKPGATFIDFPENIAEMQVDGKPIEVQTAYTSATPDFKIDQAAQIIGERQEPDHPRRQRRDPPGRRRFARELRRDAAHPGGQHVHGQGRDAVLQRAVARHHRPQGARPAVVRVREGGRRDLRRLRHGRVPPRHVEPGQRQADRPHRRAARGGRRALPRRGRRAGRHRRHAARDRGQGQAAARGRRSRRCARRWSRTAREYANDTGFPVKPQKIVHDVREVLGPEDIAISDVGAHKMWMSRMYRAERPNTCIISNGFAAMGIAVPGAIAAKLAYPDRKVIAVTGDAGFMMNSQEIETGLRMKTPFVILIWNDSEYGLITLAPAAPLRPPEPHRVQESRLREVRRELRRQGIPRRERARTSCRRSRRRSPTTPSSSSTARSTIPRT